MKTILTAMKKKNSGVPSDLLPLFENIIQSEGDFFAAMEEHLTQEQRFGLYALVGGCKGTAADKEREAFAREHAHLPLGERFALFCETFGRSGCVLNDDNTITINFSCAHGYYKRVREKKSLDDLGSLRLYFGRCAGGRLYELEKALGIKLRIKAVNIFSLEENPQSPVVFIFEITE
jgi:hypothetical protein